MELFSKLDWRRWQRAVIILMVLGLLAVEVAQVLLIQRVRSDLDVATSELERVKSTLDTVESEVSRASGSAETVDLSAIEEEVATGFGEVESELASVRSDLAEVHLAVLAECGN